MSEAVSFPPGLSSYDERAGYYLDCSERIKAGEPVWMQRTFEADRGRVLDFYQDGIHHGYIDQEDGVCDAYLLPLEGVSDKHGLIFTGGGLDLAAEALVNVVSRRHYPISG